MVSTARGDRGGAERTGNRPAPAHEPAPVPEERAAAPEAPLSRASVQLLAGAAGNAAVSRLVAQRFVAPVSPSVSQAPGMRRVNADVAAKKQKLAHHQPAATESKSAQDAAVAPPDDREAQGKVANAAKMDAAKPGVFDKAAFVKAVNDAIAAQAPKNLDEADKFSKSGKAEKIKGAVDGKVTAGKTASAHDISSATAAPPDTSAAKDKTVVPLRPDQPHANPGAPSAADAAPAPQPAAVTDFSPGPKQTDEQMKSADVTDDQLAKSNEPDFTGALKDKKQADAHSATAPGKARGAEKQQIAAAKSSAAVTGAQAMAQLTATRHTAGKAVDSGKGGAKSKDEGRRSEATARLQKVFDATKKDVEAILSGLDKKVDTQFNAGEAKARAAFEADQKARMSAYKHKRYGGPFGGMKWAKDKLLGMPKAANDLFQLSRQLYVTQMQSVISSVADTIGTDLGAAKSRIAKGRSDLAAEVRKLPADLRKFGQDAAKDFAGKFDDLESDVDDKSKQLVQTLATKYTQALNKVDEEIKKLQDANKGLVSKAVGAIAGVIKTITELKNLLMGILAKAATAISKIIKNPIGFLNNLVHAVGAGLKLFVANIADHLKKGLVSWLLGTAVKAGLNLPSSFDLKGIIQLITGLLGLTWANIRARITAKGIPDQAMTEVEKSVPVAQKLAKEGPAGVEQEIVKETGDLKATILGKLTTYLIPTVIIAGITWILSLLNPASAFVRAVKAIVDIVSFVINQGAQVVEFVNAVLDAVIAIANGGTAGVPKMVETALAAAIPTLLGLLASLLGIGNLAAKVKSVFHAVAKPVNRVIDKIVTFIAKMGKKIWAKLKSKFGKGKNKDKKSTGNDGKDGDGKSSVETTDAIREAGVVLAQRPTRQDANAKIGALAHKHGVPLRVVEEAKTETAERVHVQAMSTDSYDLPTDEAAESEEVKLLDDGRATVQERQRILSEVRGVVQNDSVIGTILQVMREGGMSKAKRLPLLQKLISLGERDGYRLTLREREVDGRPQLDMEYFGVFRESAIKVGAVRPGGTRPVGEAWVEAKSVDEGDTPVKALAVDFLVDPMIELAGVRGLGSRMFSIAAEHFRTEYRAVAGEWYTLTGYKSKSAKRPAMSKNLVDYLAARKRGEEPEQAVARTWTYSRVKQIYGGVDLDVQVWEMPGLDFDRPPEDEMIVKCLMKPR
ncbi:hypothetical protein [Streptomyces sp. NPDC021020]|uniref:hypothetical protein n=1 Tax=Streptomyces sp. NPDC021020 TaxID=3365109 RepID=UPI00379432FC